MVVQHNLQAANTNRQLGITTSAQAKSTVQQMTQQDFPFLRK